MPVGPVGSAPTTMTLAGCWCGLSACPHRPSSFAGQARAPVAGRSHDVGDALLAEQRVRPPDHGGTANVRVGQQHVLDVPWMNLLAASVDHVVAASYQVQEAVGVTEPQVAGGQPPIRPAGRTGVRPGPR